MYKYPGVFFAVSEFVATFALFHAEDAFQTYRMGGMTYIKKAFAKRFDFDSVRISQVRTDCQIRSNGKCPVG